MDKNSGKQVSAFRQIVEARLHAFFLMHKLTFLGEHSERDGLYTDLIYQASTVLLCFYQDIPEGEVNAKFSKPGIDSSTAENWVYLRRLVRKAQLAPADSHLFEVPQVPESFRQQLETLANELEAHYPELVGALTA